METMTNKELIVEARRCAKYDGLETETNNLLHDLADALEAAERSRDSWRAAMHEMDKRYGLGGTEWKKRPSRDLVRQAILSAVAWDGVHASDEVERLMRALYPEPEGADDD